MAPQTERPKVLILGSGPNRIGQGIEFDYSCVRCDHAERGRLRDRDGQLQPRDGVHRLRHRRPAVLRTAHLRGRPRGVPRRVAIRAGRPGCGRGDRAARRADAAGSGAAAGRRRGADRRDPARGHRSGRGPRQIRAGAAPSRPARTEVRHRHQLRAGPRDRGQDRLSGAGAAVLRAGRARDGDRVRREDVARLHHPRHAALTRTPGPGRPVPRRRDRDRRRRALRRHRGLHRRRDGAHRRGRHPFR